MGQDMVIDQLIGMDDVSGLADKSDKFANFLTLSRKYGFLSLYVFRTIYPNRQNWEMIMAQTHIFNFFPGSIHSGKILKTLSLFASRYKSFYVLSQNVWLNKLYFDISTSKKNNAEQLTLYQSMTYDQENLGHRQEMIKNRFVIIIEVKATNILIIFWLRESKHHKITI